MLQKALDQNIFDSAMVGFNMLNPSAKKKILPTCNEKKVGTQIMFAVRRALADKDRLIKVVAELVEQNEIGKDLVDLENPLGFVTENRDADSVIEAAYRFCSRQAGVDLVLVGTGSKEHLSEDVDAINGASLSRQILERIDAVFGGVSSVSED